MYIVDRGIRLIRGFILSYGPSNIKRHLWDTEYSGDKWNFADNTAGDCVYAHLERHAAKGSILDLGCGSGNTATEMAANTYTSYVGVDISRAALAKAAMRSKESGRQDKNRFEYGDFLTYIPTGQYDLILLRESIYHVPLAKVKATLDRYSVYLKSHGVFIVRLFTRDRDSGKSKYRPTAMLGIMESEFEVVEKCKYDDVKQSTVIVFRPRCLAAKEVCYKVDERGAEISSCLSRG